MIFVTHVYGYTGYIYRMVLRAETKEEEEEEEEV